MLHLCVAVVGRVGVSQRDIPLAFNGIDDARSTPTKGKLEPLWHCT